MISKKMEKAINDQINAEIYSAYLYLSMSSYYQYLNLPGFANWMHVQTQEEWVHVTMLYNYLINRGGRVIFKPIEGPQTDWNSPVGPFKDAYKHEQKVTGLINDLKNLAIEEKDHATSTFLDWFITEQVEEEANTDSVVRQLELIGGEGNGLFMIDQKLATRVFVAPAAASGQNSAN